MTTRIELGGVVRVVDGPFRELNGVVGEVNHDMGWLKVAVRALDALHR